MSFLLTKTIFKINEDFFETLNKWRQCVPYLYTCTFNKMTVPCYPLKEAFSEGYCYFSIINKLKYKLFHS